MLELCFSIWASMQHGRLSQTRPKTKSFSKALQAQQAPETSVAVRNKPHQLKTEHAIVRFPFLLEKGKSCHGAGRTRLMLGSGGG